MSLMIESYFLWHKFVNTLKLLYYLCCQGTLKSVALQHESLLSVQKAAVQNFLVLTQDIILLN